MTVTRAIAQRLARRYADERTTSKSHAHRLAAAYMTGYDRANSERQHCIVCHDDTGIQCCEYGRER